MAIRRPHGPLILSTLFAVLTAGCHLWPGDPAPEPASWTERYREKNNTVSSTGLDARAREIERNLGIH